MTDTKTDHNIILMRKNSTGWEKAGLRRRLSVCVCVVVPVRKQYFLCVQGSGGEKLSEVLVICLHESEYMTKHH